ncbi:FAD-dependent oxidoreductase, partial [Bacillus sp. SIMBA_161]
TRFSAANRTELLKKMTLKELEVLVIGGGITGAGIALDAALRGVQIGLIEQNDFGSGTSSRSTKLIHGGLRYLKQGDVKLVQ